MLQNWLILFGSIGLELGGAISMKYAEGFTRLTPTVMALSLYGMSLYGFSVVLKRLEVGIAYAVWAGLGTALMALIGIVFFKEDTSFLKIAGIVLIVAGVVALNLSSVKSS